MHPDHAGGCVELPAALAFRAGELAEEVLVDLAHQVAGAVLAVAAEPGVVEQVDELAEAALVDVVPVVDARQCADEGRVEPHDGVHRAVDELRRWSWPARHSTAGLPLAFSAR